LIGGALKTYRILTAPFDCAQGRHFDYEPAAFEHEIMTPKDTAGSTLRDLPESESPTF